MKASTCRFLFAVVLFGGWLGLLRAEKVQLSSEPAGATVRIIGPEGNPQEKKITQWTTPVVADISRNRTGQPYQLVFSKDGYESEVVTLDVRAKELYANPKLAPLRHEDQTRIISEPPGASIYANDRLIGVTPLVTKFLFTRADKRQPWSVISLRAELENHETLSLPVNLDNGGRDITFNPAKLLDKKRIRITARTTEGLPIERAHVFINDNKLGETPLEAELVYKRGSRTTAWPVFSVRVEIPDEYKPVRREIALEQAVDQVFELSPVTEMRVTKYFPVVEMTPRGPRFAVDTEATIGTAVDERDEGTAAESVVKITNFERRGNISLQALNSFAITPDGQSVVYGVTYESEDGKYYSNLHLRGTNPSNSTTVQLTRGPRFLDTNPTLCREADSRLVVFQSNRGRIESSDISSFRIADGRLVGGIQQLTRESRFSFRPSFVSEAQPIFFASVEAFPGADPRIASVRADGSAFTNHGEAADMVNYAENGRIYFARLAPDTKRYQLFSILADGTGSETFLSDSDFSLANCHSPNISPDGQRMLFVSDYNPDASARKDNNIWLMDLSGTRQPIQLTNNISDDIAPVWSPTEPDVIYFMSNRRGAYNVWRLTFRLAH